MRIYKQYRFPIGRKIEFKDLFSRVDAFLTQQNLSYTSIGYNLTEIDFPNRTANCRKILAKYPHFGPVERIEGPYNDDLRLSNMTGSNDSCDESMIRLIAAKIPRPYNFFDTSFYYRNVSFFGVQPSEEQVIISQDRRSILVAGSYIRISRSFEGPQTAAVFMKIEVTDASSCHRADLYAKELSGYLANVKYEESNVVHMTSDEEAHYQQIKAYAEPLVKAAREVLYMRADDVREKLLEKFPDFEEKPFRIGTILRRIGKQHGFDLQSKAWGAISYISKPVGRGIYLSVEYFGDRSGGYEGGLILSGLGFQYPIMNMSGAPENPTEAQWFVEQLFSLVDVFEKEYMGQILDLYPNALDWLPLCLDP